MFLCTQFPPSPPKPEACIVILPTVANSKTLLKELEEKSLIVRLVQKKKKKKLPKENKVFCLRMFIEKGYGIPQNSIP